MKTLAVFMIAALAGDTVSRSEAVEVQPLHWCRPATA